MYSWWWVRLSPETCRIKPLRRIKRNCCILLDLFHNYKAWYTEPQILRPVSCCLVWFQHTLRPGRGGDQPSKVRILHSLYGAQRPLTWSLSPIPYDGSWLRDQEDIPLPVGLKTLLQKPRLNLWFIPAAGFVLAGALCLEILIMKAKEMHYFWNLFDKVLYMFRTGPLSIIRSIS